MLLFVSICYIHAVAQKGTLLLVESPEKIPPAAHVAQETGSREKTPCPEDQNMFCINNTEYPRLAKKIAELLDHLLFAFAY